MEIQIQKAKEASQKAYVPYSRFQVGCALEFRSGEFILGANIENASYGATICAEGNAIGTMFSQGVDPKTIKTITIYNKEEKLCPPCGICRQMLFEVFPQDSIVIVANDKESRKILVKDLLPFAFGKDHLDV